MTFSDADDKTTTEEFGQTYEEIMHAKKWCHWRYMWNLISFATTTVL